jgi:ERF superfamily protein
MTAPQKYASVLTFAKRYALCNALGISTGDEDTNVTDVGKQADVKSIKSKILFLLRRLGHEAKSKADIEKAVEQRTQLKLVEQNYDEIVARLSSRLGKRGIRPITGGII